mmetsp:Transcript_36763/g.104651  ORF Transcript_36763/g.104651 Transcript_36763/m.104651 type:complete len:455 (+) Transcript_36763:75-1439(+)
MPPRPKQLALFRKGLTRAADAGAESAGVVDDPLDVPQEEPSAATTPSAGQRPDATGRTAWGAGRGDRKPISTVLRESAWRLRRSSWRLRRSSWGVVGRWLGMEEEDDEGAVDVFAFMKSRVSGVAMEMVALKKLVKGRIYPVFVLIECSVCLGLWLTFALLESGQGDTDFVNTKAGLDSIWETWTDLRFWGRECQDFRPQVWRWFTYQFTHDGIMHVLLNCFLVVVLGIPLEGMHGHVRMLYMFNVGVFGGACCSMVLDTHTVVVGCSGGCYALIGIHLADLILNWSQKKFRLPTLLLVVILIFVGLLSAWTSLSPEGTSHTAHLGGGIAGLFVGLTIVRNIKVEHCERYIIATCWVLSIASAIFCLSWLFAQDGGPRTTLEALAGEKGWCWYAQMLDSSLKPAQWRCVRCGSTECVRSFKAFNATESLKVGESAVEPVSLSSCRAAGWFFDGR